MRSTQTTPVLCGNPARAVRPLRATPWLVLVVALVGCGAPAPMNPPPASAPTYHHDIAPILDAHCVSCHQQGGVAPFPLTSYAEVASRAPLVRAEVDARRMPPWPPDPACNAYQSDRSLSDASRAAILAWVDAGHPEGDPNNPGPAMPRPGGGLSRMDLRLPMPVAYAPSTASADDYRCFLVPWPGTATQFVTGFRAEPGDGRVVHHVIGYLAQPADIAAYTALDAADATPGWPCFGGPGLTTTRPRWVGSWTPGSQGNDFPAGTGVRMEPGSAIVLQVHYHPGTVTDAVDQTAVAVSLADHVDHEALIIPFTNPAWPSQHTMNIPAGEPDVTHRFEVDLTGYLPLVSGNVLQAGAFRIYSANLHMHTLGTRGRFEVVRGGASGGTTCLLDIPRWNFHWQGAYFLQQPVDVHPGDSVAIECHYDNTAARQPYVNGQPTAPRDVNWGEGTADEMCLGGLYITQ